MISVCQASLQTLSNCCLSKGVHRICPWTINPFYYTTRFFWDISFVGCFKHGHFLVVFFFFYFFSL